MMMWGNGGGGRPEEEHQQTESSSSPSSSPPIAIAQTTLSSLPPPSPEPVPESIKPQLLSSAPDPEHEPPDSPTERLSERAAQSPLLKSQEPITQELVETSSTSPGPELSSPTEMTRLEEMATMAEEAPSWSAEAPSPGDEDEKEEVEEGEAVKGKEEDKEENEVKDEGDVMMEVDGDESEEEDEGLVVQGPSPQVQPPPPPPVCNEPSSPAPGNKENDDPAVSGEDSNRQGGSAKRPHTTQLSDVNSQAESGADEAEEENMSKRGRQESSSSSMPPGEEDLMIGNISYCLGCGGTGDLVCCDKCPRSYHMACLGPQGTEVKVDEPWYCRRCRTGYDQTYVKAFFQESNPAAPVREQCLGFTLFLQAHELSGDFRTPIDSSYVEYYAIVKNPMDLTTLEQRITKADPNAFYLPSFVADMRLIFHNCRIFNVEGSSISRIGELLSGFWEEFYHQRLAPKLAAVDAQALRQLQDALGITSRLLAPIKRPVGRPPKAAAAHHHHHHRHLHSPSVTTSPFKASRFALPGFGSPKATVVPGHNLNPMLSLSSGAMMPQPQQKSTLLQDPNYRRVAQAYFLFPAREAAHAQLPKVLPDGTLGTSKEATPSQESLPEVLRPPVPLRPDQQQEKICHCAHRLVQHTPTFCLPLWGADPREGLLLVSRLDQAKTKSVLFRLARGRLPLAKVQGGNHVHIYRPGTAWYQMMLALYGPDGAALRESLQRAGPLVTCFCSVPTCGQGFNNVDGLVSHMQTRHSGWVMKPLPCPPSDSASSQSSEISMDTTPS